MFTGLYDNGYIFPRKTIGAISPSTGRTLPDRYIEGTCPICGFDGARGDQCDNCGNQLDPADLINPRSRINGETPVVRGDRAVLPRPAGLRRRARYLAAEQERPVAAQRAEVLPEPAGRPAAPGHHPRPGLGRPDPAGRLAGPAGQADLRLVRRRDRLPVGVDRVGPAQRRPGRLAAVVAEPRRRVLLLHGQGQHRLPLRDLARHAAGLQRPAAPGAASRARSASWTCLGGGVQRVPDHGGPQVLLVALGRHLRPRLPGPLQRRRAALLRRGGRPGEPGHRLHLERVHPAQQRRAGGQLGQPGQPLASRSRPATSGRSPAAASSPTPTRPSWARRGTAFARVGESLSRSRFKAAITEAMRTRRPRPTSTCPTRRRGSCASPTPSGCARSCTWPCSWSTTARRCSPRSCPSRRSGSASHARRPGHAGRACRASSEVSEDGGPDYPVITGDYAQRRGVGLRADPPGTPLAAPVPLFAKLDPSVAEEELARLDGRDRERPRWTGSGGRPRRPGAAAGQRVRQPLPPGHDGRARRRRAGPGGRGGHHPGRHGGLRRPVVPVGGGLRGRARRRRSPRWPSTRTRPAAAAAGPAGRDGVLAEIAGPGRAAAGAGGRRDRAGLLPGRAPRRSCSGSGSARTSTSPRRPARR